MRQAKERKRLESDAPDYPVELPNLRREIIIIDYDFGKVVEKIQLFKTKFTGISKSLFWEYIIIE